MLYGFRGLSADRGAAVYYTLSSSSDGPPQNTPTTRPPSPPDTHSVRSSSPRSTGRWFQPCRNRQSIQRNKDVFWGIGLGLSQNINVVHLQSGAQSQVVKSGYLKRFLRVPQAVGLYCSCRAALASKENFQKTSYKTFLQPDSPRLYKTYTQYVL